MFVVFEKIPIGSKQECFIYEGLDSSHVYTENGPDFATCSVAKTKLCFVGDMV